MPWSQEKGSSPLSLKGWARTTNFIIYLFTLAKARRGVYLFFLGVATLPPALPFLAIATAKGKVAALPLARLACARVGAKAALWQEKEGEVNTKFYFVRSPPFYILSLGEASFLRIPLFGLSLWRLYFLQPCFATQPKGAPKGVGFVFI